MDCSLYKNKHEELNNLVNSLLEKNQQLSTDNANTLSCLLCKNFDKEIISNILAYLEQLVAENSYISVNWYALARVNQIVANNDRAEEAYKKAINLEPLNVDYLERMARFYMSNNNWQKALEYCNRFVGLSPEKKQIANSIMLSVCYSCKMYVEAIQNFELGIDLGNLQAVYKAMYSYIMLGNNNKVVALIDKIELSESDESYAVIDLIAQTYFTLKDYDKALENYLKLAEKDYKKYRNDVAATYSNMNNFEQSLPMLEEILAEDPNDVNALANYALTILKIDSEKNFDEAVKCYQKIICLDPLNTKAYNMLGMIHYETNNYTLAYQYYLKMFELNSNEEWIVRQLISCALGNLISGVEVSENSKNGVALWTVLKKSFQVTVNDYSIANIFYRNLKQYKEAAQNILRAIEIEPTNPHFLFSATITFKALNDNESAMKYIEKALLIDKDNLDYLNLYADILFLLKDKAKSEETYKKIVEIKENSDTLNALGWFYCEEKDYEKAISILYKALCAEMSTNGTNSDFVHKIKSNLAYAYIMDSKSNELLELMNSEDFSEIYNDEFSNSIKAITYLKVGDIEKANECMPFILSAMLPEKFSLLFRAFSAYNFKDENWAETCISNLKDIDISDSNYIAFKEDICRCLGYAYREVGDDDNAIKYFKQACQIGKSNAENWYQLGVEYLYSSNQINNKQEAYQSFETAYVCDNGKAIKPLRYLMEKLQLQVNLTAENKADIMLGFFSLAGKIEELKQALVYLDAKQVYHFTRLSVLKELVKKDGRLRINNAAHMNDPEEGKTIFRKIFKGYKSEGELDELSPPNIFLTSFCLVGDILPLWGEYGDRGKGCSLEIAHDFFDKEDNDFYHNFFISKGLKSTFKEEFDFSTVKFVKNQIADISEFATQIMPIVGDMNKSTSNGVVEQCQQIVESVHLDKGIDFIAKLFELNKPDEKEKYCLYSVVYLNEQGEITNHLKNKNDIQELLKVVKEILTNFQSDEYSSEMKDILKSISQDLLAEIQYLFKMDSYAYEQEVRIVKSMLLDDSDVKEWAPDNFSVPNLYIDMDSKLHFVSCKFGPKAEHPSKLIPYLSRNKVIDKFEVSTIQYR